MNQSSWNRNASDLVEQERKVRIEQIRAGISTRLEKTCSYLDEAEFAALVDKMSAVQHDGELGST